MRDFLANAKVRVQRLADKVPEGLTREQIRRMSDAELQARMMGYAQRFGFDSVADLMAAVERDPVLGPLSRERR